MQCLQQGAGKTAFVRNAYRAYNAMLDRLTLVSSQEQGVARRKHTCTRQTYQTPQGPGRLLRKVMLLSKFFHLALERDLRRPDALDVHVFGKLEFARLRHCVSPNPPRPHPSFSPSVTSDCPVDLAQVFACALGAVRTHRDTSPMLLHCTSLGRSKRSARNLHHSVAYEYSIHTVPGTAQ